MDNPVVNGADALGLAPATERPASEMAEDRCRDVEVSAPIEN
jgi:hypothetical protein